MVIWFWTERNVWMMTRLTMVNTESAYACVQQDVSNPTLVTKAWNVYDKSVGSHVADENLKMVAADATQEKEETTQSLKQDTEELQTTLQQMQICLDDLTDTIRFQDETITELGDDLQSYEDAMKDLGQETRQTQDNVKQTKRRLYALHNAYKKLQEDNENLMKRIQARKTEPCDSYAVVNEIDVDEQIITNSLSRLEVADILGPLSCNEDVCRSILERFQSY